MVKQIIDREWSPAQKWIAGLLTVAVVAVCTAATKGYIAYDNVQRLESKVESRAAKEIQNSERYGRIAATLEDFQKQLNRIEKKLDRHTDNYREQKQFDSGN